MLQMGIITATESQKINVKMWEDNNTDPQKQMQQQQKTLHIQSAQ